MMKKGSAQAQKLRQRIDARKEYPNTQAWLDSLLEVLSGEQRLMNDSLALLEQELRGGYGWEYTRIQDEYAEHISFWQTLSQRFPDQPKLLGIYADTLLLAGHTEQALEAFLLAFAADPTLVYEFGGELYDFYLEKGGDYWLDYQLVLVQAALKTDNEEYAKEVYRRLLVNYRNQPAAMQKIKKIAIESL
jgi:tetratricopeptide (TPR) repeat protein